MAITLARICANAEKTYGMKLIAGRAGMDNFVRWVHIVEDSEVPDFMHGNELVFTTGIGHKGSGWLLDFVRQLKGKNAAGVVVNIGPYINAVPKDVMEYCECNALPHLTGGNCVGCLLCTLVCPTGSITHSKRVKKPGR